MRNRNALVLLAVSVALGSAVTSVEARGGNNPQVQQIVLHNFDITQQRLRGQIADNVSTGRLSRDQAANFTSQLDDIAAQTPDSVVDPWRTQFLVNRFSMITSQMNSSLAAPGTYRSYTAHGHWNNYWGGNQWRGNQGQGNSFWGSQRWKDYGRFGPNYNTGYREQSRWY